MEEKTIETVVKEDVKTVAKENVETGVNVIEEINKLVESLVNKEVVNENISELTFDSTILYGDSEQKKSFFSDYAKYFGEVTNPKNTKENLHFHFKYAPLDEVMNTIRPIMSKHGFSLIQIPAIVGDKVVVNNLLTHKSGAYMTFEGLVLRPQKPDVQGVGGAITYGRRYTASAIAGVMAEEDNDGNAPNNTNGKDGGTVTKVPLKGKIETSKATTLKQLKNKTNILAKEKIETKGADDVTALIEKVLGKKLKDTKKEDIDKINELYKRLEEM